MHARGGICLDRHVFSYTVMDMTYCMYKMTKAAILSIQIDSAWNRGNKELAYRHSVRAKRCTICGMISGFFIIMLSLTIGLSLIIR